MSNELTTAARDPRTEEQTVAALQRLIRESDPGTQAALRRAGSNDVPVAFYRLTATLLDDVAPGQGPVRDRLERRWLAIAQAIAQATSLLGPAPLGAALAAAKVSELRVNRLLSARDEALFDAVRVTVHQLVSTGHTFDPQQLAKLVLSDGRRDEDETRRRIARDYYRHQTT